MFLVLSLEKRLGRVVRLVLMIDGLIAFSVSGHGGKP